MKRFLAIGECMIELAVQENGLYAMGFAGDTFNTAWYARRLAAPDVEVGYLSAVGDDEPSARMTAFMADAGVVPKLAVRKGGTVGLYMISLKDGERSFSYWRSTSAARSLASDLDRLPDLEAGDIAYFSGITLAILPEADRTRFLEVLTEARSRGVIVAFDPNLRPRLWPGREAMCSAIMQAAAVSDIALPSHEDEATHFGDADTIATANRYAAAGVPLVVVKNGGGELFVRSPEGDLRHMPARVASVIDTTAAGDAFNAGCLVRLAGGAPVAEALVEGCRVAARVIGARGALVAI